MKYVVLIASAALAACSGGQPYRCDVDGFYVIPRDDRSEKATDALSKNIALQNRRIEYQLKMRGYTSEASLEKAEGCP